MKKILLLLPVMLFLCISGNSQLIIDAGIDQAICQGYSVNLGGAPTASGGTPPYSYQWSPGAALNSNVVANPLAIPLNTTMFSVTVTDALSDTASDFVTVTVFMNPVVDLGLDQTTCQGSCDTLDGTITGGSPPFIYSWSGPSGFSSGVSSPVICLDAGTYSLTVTDQNACGGFDNVLVSFQTCGQFSIIHQNVLCNGACNGTAQVNPSGNYYYQWNTGDTSQTISNLCAGLYRVTVYDLAYNLLDTAVAIITQPAQMTLSTSLNNVTCFGANDGTIVTTVNGGTPPYSYNWSNSSTGPVLNNLSAGNYDVIVIDANNCPASATFTVNQPPLITISVFDSSTSSCSACDGSAAANVGGGTAPYSYVWSDAGIGQNRFGLCAGTYTLTLVDGNGCSVSAGATINSPINNVSATMVASDMDCAHPVSNATLTILNGSAPYMVNWNDGTFDSSSTSNVFQHAFIATQSSSFLITIQYSDSSACWNTIRDTVLNNGLLINTVFIRHPGCSFPNSGAIKVRAVNGAVPYFFSWSNGSIIDSIANLASGNYSVTITDSTGCTASQSFTLQNGSSSLYATAYGGSASCTSGGVGNATIYATGGNPPYVYLWGTTPLQNTQTATNIPPGIYGFTVTDNGGCSVANSTNIQFTSYGFYVYVSTAVSPNCGLSNGVVSAYAYGGTPPFSYHWNDNQTGQTDTALASGLHTVTVTDVGGCSATGQVNLLSICYNTISGIIYDDINGNCIFDGSDVPRQGVSLTASNGNAYGWGYSDATGHYSIVVHDTGTFTIQVYNSSWGACGHFTPCGNPLSVNFSGFNNTLANRNYGFNATSGFDLALHPGWTSAANPGFPKTYWIYYYNQSPQAFTGNATLTFKYDSNLIYQSSAPPLPAHNALTHTLTWNVTSVDNWDYRGQCHFTISPSLPSGYLLQSDFYITPTAGDCDSTNNHEHYAELITSSRDPNEKEVSPSGSIYEEDSVLTYTIHFQNTGTDTTWFVILKDTLSENLDPASVRNLASSHTYSEFSISGKGILTWVFNPVYLVDSATNEDASKGFVTFSVKKKSNLLLGTTITNRASIVFDYNEPILTNTVADTLSMPNYVFSIPGEGISVHAFPNPFSASTTITVEGLSGKFDFTLFDVTGSCKKRIGSVDKGKFEMNRDDLAAGIYFYKISNNHGQDAFGKLVVE